MGTRFISRFTHAENKIKQVKRLKATAECCCFLKKNSYRGKCNMRNSCKTDRFNNTQQGTVKQKRIMQQLFQQGKKHIYFLFMLYLQHAQHVCNDNENTVAFCCTATIATNAILAVKEEKTKTSVQQCLQQMQLVVFLLQLSLSSSIIMPKFSISDAAKRAGVERTTLYRKLNKGEISAEIDAHGNKVIDASELLRVYPEATVIDNPATNVQQMHTVETQQNATADATMAVLLREAEMREEKIEDMKRRIEALEADKTDLRSERDRLLKVIEEQSASVKLLTAGDQTKAKTGRRFFIFGRRS